jgi:hypothetical protein
MMNTYCNMHNQSNSYVDKCGNPESAEYGILHSWSQDLQRQMPAKKPESASSTV